MLFAMFATMEKRFIEVARNTICEILTAAASALVGHLFDTYTNFQNRIIIIYTMFSNKYEMLALHLMYHQFMRLYSTYVYT